MKTLHIPDPYNCEKFWIIKRSDCRHYYVSQEISGYRIYPFKRTKRASIEKVLNRDILTLFKEATWAGSYSH